MRLPVLLLLSLSLGLAGCDDAVSMCGDSASCSGGESFAVRANSVGYQPARTKRASWRGDATSFRVLRADGGVAFEGEAQGPVQAHDSDEELWIGDFSALAEEGSFEVVVDGVGKSPPFRIAEDVFVEPLRTMMLGLYGQRCGQSVSLAFDEASFEHGECHGGDSALLQPGTEEVADVTKGWHDAGDYGKYVNNGAFSLGMMLLAWENFQDKLVALELPIPETGGALPDYLDECAFQLAWLFGMQRADGGVADRVTTASFDPDDTRPEASTMPRKLSGVSSVASADFAAVMAMAARIYAPYDADLAARALAAAESAQAFLGVNPGPVTTNLQGFTGGYSSGDGDDRLWALAELWQSTGNEAYLGELEVRLPEQQVSYNWDWADLQNLGIMSYVLSEREGRNVELVAEYQSALVASADSLASSAEAHAYGRSLGSMYYWGINGVLARSVLNLMVAERLTGEARYLDAATLQLDHLLGRNYYGRSMVTGIGYAPPSHPHHRPSTADRRAWPGLLVGGSHGDDPKAVNWKDQSQDYETNEVAINWNAALIYALAGFVP